MENAPRRGMITAAAAAAVVAMTYAVLLKSKGKREDEGAAVVGRKRLKDVPLAPPIISELGSKSITTWRQNYRRFRTGDSHGSSGEGSARFKLEKPGRRDLSLGRSLGGNELATVGAAAAAAATTTPSEMGGGLRSIYSIVPAEDSVADAENAIEHAQNLLTEFRLSYRRHRMGASVGAKGELADLVAQMGRDSLRLLPAAQVATLKRAHSLGVTSPSSPAGASPGKAGRFHVHFGAGKLGLGLIIPAICKSGVPYAIVQRPSGAFGPILGDSEDAKGGPRKVALTVNGAGGGDSLLALATDAAELPPVWRQWLEAMGTSPDSELPPCPLEVLSGAVPRGLFVCAAAASPLCEALVKAATSFSTSLGPGIGGLKAMLSEDRLPLVSGGAGAPSRAARALFAGENDHKAVDDLSEALTGRCDVVSCMVDRICTGRDIFCGPKEAAAAGAAGGEGSDGGRTVAVTAEPYAGAIVVLTPPKHVKDPPFAGDNVLVPRVSAEADYLCRRKLLMVNGMHTTLAFLTLSSEVPAGTHVPLQNDKLQPPFSDLPLVTLRTAKTDAQRTLIRAWMVARILLLFFEYDIEVIKSSHGCTEDERVVDIIVEYALNTVERFSTADDTTGRVLGGGVAARFNGRLLPVMTFLDENIWTGASSRASAPLLSGVPRSPTRKSAARESPIPKSPASPRRKRRDVMSMVLSKTGMNFATIEESVRALTNAAQRFTGLTAPIGSPA